MSLLYETGMTAQTIGQLFNCSGTSVVKRLRNQKVVIRTHTDQADINRQKRLDVKCGGRLAGPRGYRYVALPRTHKFFSMAKNSRGQIAEHRLIMAENLGRPLIDDESVHHINGDVVDNRIENLQLMSNGHPRGVSICCLDCGSQNIGHLEIEV